MGQQFGMALYKYLRPFDDPSRSLSAYVPPATVKNMARQVKEVQSGTKRGECSKVPQDEKICIAKYASLNGVVHAVRHYKERNLNESSIGD